jgi:UDP-N-acetylglucosamine acyltransferase
LNPVHPTACIAATAKLAADVRVAAYAIVEDEVVIGEGTRIAAHAVIKRYTQIGRDNRIYEHAVIGGDPQDLKFAECESHVVIGDANYIREGVTIHRGSTPGSVTRIGDRCFLMANCHVAHDCVLGNNVVMANGALLGGVVEVHDQAFISGAVTVHQFCRVGRLAMVAASARVNQDCLPFIITDGMPGRARALNAVGLRRAGVSRKDLDALKRAFRVLRSSDTLEAALTGLAAFDSPYSAELAEFIRKSKRGFAHVKRGASDIVS